MSYYDRALYAVFGEAYTKLSDRGKQALQEDCRLLHNDPGADEDRCYDRYGVVKVLMERIGGSRNLASYVDCLLAGKKGR